jgi:hypothetical protein
MFGRFYHSANHLFDRHTYDIFECRDSFGPDIADAINLFYDAAKSVHFQCSVRDSSVDQFEGTIEKLERATKILEECLASNTPDAMTAPSADNSVPPGTPTREASEAKATQGDDPSSWITFKEARATTGLRDDEITRACDSGQVRSKGKRKGRLVHAGDITRFVSGREDRRR